MAENNIGKLILDLLKDYDYANVRPDRLKKVMGSRCIGACDHGRHKIYVSNDLPVAMQEITQLHEFAHAYYATIGVEAPEEMVDALAMHWRRHLYINIEGPLESKVLGPGEHNGIKR